MVRTLQEVFPAVELEVIKVRCPSLLRGCELDILAILISS